MNWNWQPIFLCWYKCAGISVCLYILTSGEGYTHFVHMCASVVEGKSGDICAPVYMEV